MDCGTEDPPTSIVPPAESDFSKVIFTNVPKFYAPKTDVRCQFCKEENFVTSPKDWIGIFKVGWKTTREYFTWISARTSEDNTVLFTAYYLPKDDEYYQFCYVDQNGEVRGASIPFQFCYNIPEDEDDILMVTTEMEIMMKNEENAELKEVVKKLTEENSALQEKVSSLQNENQSQAVRIQNLQDDLLSSAEKIQRLETENMEQTVQIKYLKDGSEVMNKTIQSLDIDLQMQRNQEEKLLSEIKEMEKSKDNIQEEKKHFEKLQIHVKSLEEKTKKLELELKLYKEKEQTFLSDREQMEKSLQKSEAEKHFFQSENMAKQKVVENLTRTVNQCKEETVKLKAELELQTCTLEKEKKQKENLRESLDKQIKRALDLEQNMKQKIEKLKCAEKTMADLSKQVDSLKAENEDKMKQMGVLHITIANLEGEVNRVKDENKNKMEAERKAAVEKMQDLEQQVAQQKDACREQGEEIFTLRNALELREEEIRDMQNVMKDNRAQKDNLHSNLLDRGPTTSMTPSQSLMFGNPYEGNYASFSREHGSSSTSRRPSSPLECPVCGERFLARDHQILADHVLCHLDEGEARS